MNKYYQVWSNYYFDVNRHKIGEIEPVNHFHKSDVEAGGIDGKFAFRLAKRTISMHIREMKINTTFPYITNDKA